MNTVFVGGSRRVPTLPPQARERLQKVINSGAHVIVGDANGADKAVQKFLRDNRYENVTVFCSGNACRNNLGQWEARFVSAPRNAKGFDFYAAKDREMAREADFGLMIWDGKSVGTILNILRLIKAAKKAVLLNVVDEATLTFKSTRDWDSFFNGLSPEIRDDVRKRAKSQEWITYEPEQQTSLLEEPDEAPRSALVSAISEDDIAAKLNAALAAGDAVSVVDTLGNVAKARGMSQVAKDTGLARESLYRSLSIGGNPEFTTVLKVLSAMGLRLMVGKAFNKVHNEQS